MVCGVVFTREGEARVGVISEGLASKGRIYAHDMPAHECDTGGGNPHRPQSLTPVILVVA